ncbi:hypothetical protein HD553DRAFT_323251 [Filobasidium floriforme]|uniref:uncharacterized protein n=1 Tax=Filobasidium floriforme TaxID=5210 RepID=UPI001E8E6AFE|nr:uncharacterized protein HD553DRAFT_323251 [Filobasidium floriforme]KAH8087089.1 hypothetical protein HD553DRAFT_323251 [Filobasidium floriforme]
MFNNLKSIIPLTLSLLSFAVLAMVPGGSISGHDPSMTRVPFIAITTTIALDGVSIVSYRRSRTRRDGRLRRASQSWSPDRMRDSAIWFIRDRLPPLLSAPHPQHDESCEFCTEGDIPMRLSECQGEQVDVAREHVIDKQPPRARDASTGLDNEGATTGQSEPSLEQSFVTAARTELEGGSTQGDGIYHLLERYEHLKDDLEAKVTNKSSVADQEGRNLVAEALDKGRALQVIEAYRCRNSSGYVDDQRKAKLDRLFEEYRKDRTKEAIPYLDPFQLIRARDACFAAFPRPGGAFVPREVYLDLVKWIVRTENQPKVVPESINPDNCVVIHEDCLLIGRPAQFHLDVFPAVHDTREYSCRQAELGRSLLAICPILRQSTYRRVIDPERATRFAYEAMWRNHHKILAKHGMSDSLSLRGCRYPIGPTKPIHLDLLRTNFFSQKHIDMDLLRDRSDISVSEASTDTSSFAWTEAGATTLEQSYRRYEGTLQTAHRLSYTSKRFQVRTTRKAVRPPASAKSRAITSKPGGRVDKSSRFARGSRLSSMSHSLETRTEHGTEEVEKSDVDYEQTMDAAKGMILFGAYRERQQPSSAIDLNHSWSFDRNLEIYQRHAANTAGRRIPEKLEWERLKEACFAAFRHPFISEGIFFTFCELFMRHAMIDAEGLEEELASLKIDSQSEKSEQHQTEASRQNRDQQNDQDAEMYELEFHSKNSEVFVISLGETSGPVSSGAFRNPSSVEAKSQSTKSENDSAKAQSKISRIRRGRVAMHRGQYVKGKPWISVWRPYSNQGVLETLVKVHKPAGDTLSVSTASSSVMSTNTQAEQSFRLLPDSHDQRDDITKFRKAYIEAEPIFMEAASDAMSKGYQLNFSGSFSRLSVGTDWGTIRTIAPEYASEEKLWRDRISRCRALIIWHAYKNDEGTLDQEKQERHYRLVQHDIERWETDYNEDVENKVKIRLLDSSDQTQDSAERDHIVLDPKRLAQAIDSLSSQLPDLVFEYGDFKAVCGIAIGESSTTGLVHSLTLEEHASGNETEMGDNNDDDGSESDIEMGGMELRSGRVVRRG